MPRLPVGWHPQVCRSMARAGGNLLQLDLHTSSKSHLRSDSHFYHGCLTGAVLVGDEFESRKYGSGSACTAPKIKVMHRQISNAHLSRAQQ